MGKLKIKVTLVANYCINNHILIPERDLPAMLENQKCYTCTYVLNQDLYTKQPKSQSEAKFIYTNQKKFRIY
ncbi:hypothetical protein DP117_25940 [Brasilonema sp. UFV-L1]|nr:hypothetical protein [Brasilonema sp. UFV-L1]